MELVVGSTVRIWEHAARELGGAVVRVGRHGGGVEAELRMGSQTRSRRLLVRWHFEGGVVCEGDEEDILAFQEACEARGFCFRLDSCSLCG